MDHEKKYKEALERAREALNDGTISSNTIAYLQDIFPELKESEDEKIRKELITHCRNTRCVTEEGAERIAKWIAWLEKQGEQKVSYTTLMETGNGGINALVTKELPTDGCDDEQKHYIDIDKMVDDYANNKERGNEEFGKPVPCMIRAYRQGLNDAIEKVVRNPAWSEEDEKMCQETIDWFEKKCFPYALESENPARESIKWLKSLKERCTWKPSEEQLDALKRTQTGVIQFSVLQSLYNDLKKL